RQRRGGFRSLGTRSVRRRRGHLPDHARRARQARRPLPGPPVADRHPLSPRISARTRTVVLLGDPVEHSLSPLFQNAGFAAAGLDAVYVALRCTGADLPGLLVGIARAGGAGNVTVPHKAIAARTVERPTEAVLRTNACNTFWLEGETVC